MDKAAWPDFRNTAVRVFGLTGGIASGKSTVANILHAHGIPVIDADKVARQVVEPNGPGLAKIVEEFGPEILHQDGSLDRARMASLVFSNPHARKRLNTLTHPLIMSEMARQVEELVGQGHRVVVMDIPLLYEEGDPGKFSGVIVVYTHRQSQLERLIRRDPIQRAEAQMRLDAQMPLDEKRDRATVVIDNCGTEEHTYEQVYAWLKQVQAELDMSPTVHSEKQNS